MRSASASQNIVQSVAACNSENGTARPDWRWLGRTIIAPPAISPDALLAPGSVPRTRVEAHAAAQERHACHEIELIDWAQRASGGCIGRPLGRGLIDLADAHEADRVRGVGDLDE
jgi:hypothetical protein